MVKNSARLKRYVKSKVSVSGARIKAEAKKRYAEYKESRAKQAVRKAELKSIYQQAYEEELAKLRARRSAEREAGARETGRARARYAALPKRRKLSRAVQALQKGARKAQKRRKKLYKKRKKLYKTKREPLFKPIKIEPINIDFGFGTPRRRKKKR